MAIELYDVPKSVEKLVKFTESANIAEDIKNERLQKIGAKVHEEYLIDESSRSDWKDRIEEAIKLAMQVAEGKSYPWMNASNIKYPLMTSAAIQFAARAYPAIVPGSNPVKVKTQGKMSDEKRQKADRVSDHMSWQVTEEMPEWDEDTDKLLHVLPIVGMLYRKTYFSKDLGRNVSELSLPDKVVVNYHAKSLDRAPRITEEIGLYPNEVTERRRSGTFLDIELPKSTGEDDNAPIEFLEQHRWLDLDDDDYEEPYIVTIHKETHKVVRIVARYEPGDIKLNPKGKIRKITPVQYYTKYSFLPSLDGSFYDIGFGVLLTPINESINASINQMLDAGHIQNVGGGLIANSLRIRGGTMRFKPGEYKQVAVPPGMTMTTAVYDFKHPGPSQVLFELLGLMLEAGKEVASIKDALTGEAAGPNEPVGTTLARIEQGLKVFSAIYKRVYRSLKSEFKKMAKLNAVYLNPQTYFMLHDDQKVAGPEDYNLDDLDIVPVADPSSVSDAQKLFRAEFLMPFKAEADMDRKEINRRALEAANIPDIEDLFLKKKPPLPPEIIEKMHDARMDEKRAEQEDRRIAMEGEKLLAEMAKMQSETILNFAKAEGEVAGQQLESYKAQMREITERIKAHAQVEQGRLRGMENPSNNKNGATASKTS